MEIPTIMGHTSAGITVNTLSRYRLMAYPDMETALFIKAEQQYIQRKYQTTLPVQPTGIVVAEFMAREDMEATLIRWMHRIISTQSSFQISIQGFGALSSRQLYLRVQEQQPFQQLANAMQVVDQYIRSYDCPPAKRFTHPYLPLTEAVPDQEFKKVVDEYAERKLDVSFEVKELLLIRNSQDAETGKQINLFRLQPGAGK